MKKLLKNKKLFIVWIASLLATGLFFGILIHIITIENAEAVVSTLDEGWTVVDKTGKHEDVNLQEYTFSKVQPGDEVTLSRVLPEGMKEHQSMTLLTYLSMVEVRVDNGLQYSYGKRLLDEGKMVGSGYHIVDLPDYASGKLIVIHITACEPDAFTSIGSIKYGTLRDLFFAYMKENVVTVIVCTFLIVLGALMIALAAFSVILVNNYRKFLPISFFSLLVGIYGLCSIKFFELCGISLYATTICEYMTLYFIPTPIAMVFATIRKNTKGIQKLLYASATVFLSTGVVLCLLHYGNIVHFPRVLRVFHVCAFLMLVEGSFVVIYNLKKGIKANTYMTNGFIVLCVCALTDLIRFNLLKYVFVNTEIIQFTFLPIGALIFIVLMMINTMLSIYHVEVEEAEKRVLVELAYKDVLCGVFNRTKCQQRFDQMDKEKEVYAIMNLDMNGLKKVNDEQGHSKGDELLKDFAEILKDSFEDIGTAYRMGGDEFLVVIDEGHLPYFDKGLKTFEKKQKRAGMSSAYGIAYSTEVEHATTAKVYSLADQRMYEMKTSYYKNKD